MPSAENGTNTSVNSDSNSFSTRATHKQVLTAPLPDPITRNIEAITSLHTQDVRDIPAYQRLLEAIATFFSRSTFLYSLLIIQLIDYPGALDC